MCELPQSDAMLDRGSWTELSGPLPEEQLIFLRSDGVDLAAENARLKSANAELHARCELLENADRLPDPSTQNGVINVKLRSDTGLVSHYTKPRGTKFHPVMRQFCDEHDLRWDETMFFHLGRLMSQATPLDVVTNEVLVATEGRMPPDPPTNDWMVLCEKPGGNCKFRAMFTEPRKEFAYRAASDMVPASSYSYYTASGKLHPLEIWDFGPFEGDELPKGFPSILVIADNKRKRDEEEDAPSKIVCT